MAVSIAPPRVVQASRSVAFVENNSGTMLTRGYVDLNLSLTRAVVNAFARP
jgi:hypothetical protein